MRAPRPGGELWLEEGGVEEPMAGNFNGANLARRSARRNGHARLDESGFEFRIHFVIAEKFSLQLVEFADDSQSSPGNYSDRTFAGKFRRVGGTIGNRAGDRSDDNISRVSLVFGGVCVGELQNVAGIL